jgi:hypothetical protein
VPVQDCRAVFTKDPARILIERYAQFLLAEARQSVACQAFHALDRRLHAGSGSAISAAALGSELPLTQEFMATMLGQQACFGHRGAAKTRARRQDQPRQSHHR